LARAIGIKRHEGAPITIALTAVTNQQIFTFSAQVLDGKSCTGVQQRWAGSLHAVQAAIDVEVQFIVEQGNGLRLIRSWEARFRTQKAPIAEVLQVGF
jgi:hypothetical protein